MKRQFTLLLIFSFLIGLNFAFAQTGKNTIEGVVRTSDGKNAQDVKVTIDGTEIEKITNEKGHFTIDGLADGRYNIIISAPGSIDITKTIDINGGNKITTEFKLGISLAQLDEVIVSSTRFGKNRPSSTLRLNEPLLQVPQVIQVIGANTMIAQQVTSVSDGLLKDIPGATRLEHWGDVYARVNMRGSRAAAFRNGMNVTSNWGPLTEDMSFVDRIEVVRGPAGFMMSNGEPSGLYNVVTKKPTGITKGSAGIMFGSYDLYRATADLDGRFDSAGKVLYRFNLMGQTKNSFRPYEYNNRFAIAPVIQYNVDDQNTLTLEYIYQHDKMSNLGSYYIFTTKGYGVYNRDFTETNPEIEPTNIDEHNVTVNFVHRFNDNWKLTTQASYMTTKQVGSSMWLDSITSDDRIRRTVSMFDAINTMKFGQMYLNGEVKTGAVNHRILAGLDLGDKEFYGAWNQSKEIDANNALFDPNNPSYTTPSNGLPVFDRSLSIQQMAGIYGTITQKYSGLYLQDELGFFDNVFRVTLAGRYTSDREVSYGTPTSGNRFTPRVGLSASLDKWTSVYALFDQTYVPQSGIRRDGQTVKPVTGNNLEFGFKKDWAEGKWGSTFSIYRILKNNQTSNDPANTPSEVYVVQFGQTKTQGIEFDIHGEVLPGFNVMANYALTDSKITKADSSSASQLTIGDKVPGYAKHVINGWGSYEFQKGFLKGFGLNLAYNFQGHRTTWSWSGASGQLALPDYIKFDGGLFWKNDKMRITATMMNLMNRYLYSGASYGSYYYYQAEAGRNFRLSLDVNF
ncbi:TonB-dependent receptor [Rhizosphaericola mali]|uniref:TonB-dependent receptor n=1 Tax=Rhizosphaericola mali TaxID=2545455 RepID=A0A5P2GG75_9BACT|nr:TonB-dependent receptor [Rhizosphaericola mali]QES90711.1 TonB-dependent receptor [Rhizosphaericola mali]